MGAAGVNGPESGIANSGTDVGRGAIATGAGTCLAAAGRGLAFSRWRPPRQELNQCGSKAAQAIAVANPPLQPRPAG